MPLKLPPTIWANRRLEWGQHTHVMGIINVTPDSFSGDGLVHDIVDQEEFVQRAVRQAQQFYAEGARLIDVGGESTRPEFEPLLAEQELARVIPVIRKLREVLPEDAMISIDTYKADVAKQALEAGACIINDIWALRH